MDITFRPATHDELPQLRHTDEIAFGDRQTDTERDRLAEKLIDPARTAAAFDGDDMVGASAAHEFDLTLPGGVPVPVAGVTWVGVLPTHTRRGVLRGMMRVLLDQARARNESLAVLWASESSIYGRFGYGMASQFWQVSLDRRQCRLRPDVERSGSLRLLRDVDEVRKVLPGIYDDYRRRQPGAISRSEAFWELRTTPTPDDHVARFDVVHEAPDGSVDGYATYRVKPDWLDAQKLPNADVRVAEIVATTASARAALWEYLLDLDLSTTVRVWGVPPDEPLRWWLTDPRQLHVTTVADGLWVRPLDVAALLTSRRYAGEGRLVLDVVDDVLPDVGGRFALEVDGGAGTCTRTTHDADIRLDVAALGSVSLGGFGLAELARAGRVREVRPGAVAEADRVLMCDRPPSCCTMF